MLKQISTACVVLLLGVQSASAHFLWLGVAESDGKPSVVSLYFEEGPHPGDGKYLDPFVERGKTWVRTAEGKKAEELKLSVVKKPGKRWLAGEVKGRVARAESYGKFGVYSYGKTEVLLHYHAKYINAASAKELEAVAKAEQLQFEIIPRRSGDEVELQVLWKGKPAAERTVYIRGPGFRQNPKTDKDGVVRIKAEKKGQYIMRTFVEQKEAGTDAGKKYDLIRHWSMLTINLGPVE